MSASHNDGANAPRSTDQWKVLDRELLYDATPWVQLYREEVELPSGRRIDDFYHLKLPDFCAIVAVTPQGEFVMVRGYKHGVGRVILSPPAGMIDEGEEPLEAAQRELLEETGYRADSWKNLGQFVVDGNRHCGTMHLFYASDAIRVQAPQQDEMENLQCELLDAKSVTKALMMGEIGNLAGASAAAMGLLFSQS